MKTILFTRTKCYFFVVKNKISGEEIKTLPQCRFRGETYNYGEKFVPQIHYSACHHCVCDENFDNSTSIEENKNCKKMDCGMQLRYMDEFKNGCIPIYFRDTKCCPIGFRCRKFHYFNVCSPNLCSANFFFYHSFCER